jgi:murein DD-endopeptidase MepM/ murein hydrolase activator NlpD
VRSDRDEDRVLTDRRRLLQYYGALDATAPLTREGIVFGAPLDGAPRVVSSLVGSDRDDGERAHRGVDIESTFGEPVRAIADGRVTFAGVDLPGHRHNEQMDPKAVAEVARRSLGAGGRYVCISHARAGAPPLRSCYMHLETIEVQGGATIRRGDRVGTVGRTGMQSSAPHLHLELHGPDGLMDPRTVLDGLLIGEP